MYLSILKYLKTMCPRLALPVVEASIFVLRSRGEAAWHLFKWWRLWNMQKLY
jgi:hypothetical protein